MGFINYLKMQIPVAILITLAVLSSAQHLSSKGQFNQITTNQALEQPNNQMISPVAWEANSQRRNLQTPICPRPIQLLMIQTPQTYTIDQIQSEQITPSDWLEFSFFSPNHPSYSYDRFQNTIRIESVPFSMANTLIQGVLISRSSFRSDIACFVDFNIGDAPCFKLTRSIKPAIKFCVLIGLEGFDAVVPELYDDNSALNGDNSLCGMSTYATIPSITSWFLETELDFTLYATGATPSLSVGPDLTESKLGTYYFTFFRTFDPALNIVFQNDMILSVNNPYKLRGLAKNENYLQLSAWSTFPYRELTFDWQQIKCTHPDQLPPSKQSLANNLQSFNTTFNTEQEYADNLYDYFIQTGRLTGSNHELRSEVYFASPYPQVFVSNAQQDFWFSSAQYIPTIQVLQKTLLFVNNVQTLTLIDDWGVITMASPSIPPISFIAYIGIEMTLDLSQLVYGQQFNASPELTGIATQNQLKLVIGILSQEKLGKCIGSLVTTSGNTIKVTIDVLSPYILDGSELPFAYDWSNTEFSLDFRRVAFNQTAIALVEPQMLAMESNSYYQLLMDSFNGKLQPGISLWSQYMTQNDAQTIKEVSSVQIDEQTTNARVRPLDSGRFEFFTNNLSDMGKSFRLTQTTDVYYKDKFIQRLIVPYGTISVSKPDKCQTMILQAQSQLLPMSVNIGEVALQFFKNVTDNLGVLSNNQTACGTPTYELEKNKTGTVAPTFMKIENQRIVVRPSLLEEVGIYLINLKYSLPQSKREFVQTFQVVVSQNQTADVAKLKINTAPFFLVGFGGRLRDETAFIGETKTISLPEMRDDEGDSISVTLGFSDPFMGVQVGYSYQQNAIQLTVPSTYKNTTEQVYVTLSDSLLQSRYFFYLRTEFKTPDNTLGPPDLWLKPQQSAERLDGRAQTMYKSMQSLDWRKKSYVQSSKQCIPRRSIANQDGIIDFEFATEIRLDTSPNLLAKIKRTKSIQCQLYPADESQQPTDFEWSLEQFGNFTLRMRFNYTDPFAISRGTSGNDMMRVVFKDTSKFIKCPNLGQVGGRRELQETIPYDFSMLVKLPAMYETNYTVTTGQVMDQLKQPSVQSAISIQLLINYINGLSATLLWGGINALQLIANMALFNIVVPSNSKLLFRYLMNMTKFDMYYDIWNPIENVGFSETPPYNDRFDELGMGSLGFFDALGSVTVILIATVISQILKPIFVSIARRAGIERMSWYRYLRFNTDMLGQTRYSVVNTWLRIVLEEYIGIVIAAWLALYSPPFIAIDDNEMNRPDKINYASAIIAITIVVLFTFLVSFLAFYQFRSSVWQEKVTQMTARVEMLIEFYRNQQEEESEQSDASVSFAQSEMKKMNKIQNFTNMEKTARGSKPRKRRKAPWMRKSKSLQTKSTQEQTTIKQSTFPLTPFESGQVEAKPKDPSENDTKLRLQTRKTVSFFKDKENNLMQFNPLDESEENEKPNQAKQLPRPLIRPQPVLIEEESHVVIDLRKKPLMRKNKTMELTKQPTPVIVPESSIEEELKSSNDEVRIPIAMHPLEQSNASANEKQSIDENLPAPLKLFKLKSSIKQKRKDDLTSIQRHIRFQLNIETDSKPGDDQVGSPSGVSLSKSPDQSPGSKKSSLGVFSGIQTDSVSAMSRPSGRSPVSFYSLPSKRLSVYLKKEKQPQQLRRKKALKSNKYIMSSKELRFQIEEANRESPDRVLINNKKLYLQQEELKRQQQEIDDLPPSKFDLEYVSCLRENLKEGSYGTLYYHMIFLARRILLVYSAFRLNEAAFFQVILFLIGTQLTMVYIVHVQPFETNFENRMEFFNDFIVLLVSYHQLLLLSSDFGPKATEGVGISLNITIGLIGVVNSIIIAVSAVQAIKEFFKKILISRKAARIAPIVVNDEQESLESEQLNQGFRFNHWDDRSEFFSEYYYGSEDGSEDGPGNDSEEDEDFKSSDSSAYDKEDRSDTLQFMVESVSTPRLEVDHIEIQGSPLAREIKIKNSDSADNNEPRLIDPESQI